MVAFNLPANSRVRHGNTHKAPAGAKRVREFRVYRWNPDDGQNPSTDTYFIDTNDPVHGTRLPILMIPLIADFLMRFALDAASGRNVC